MEVIGTQEQKETVCIEHTADVSLKTSPKDSLFALLVVEIQLPNAHLISGALMTKDLATLTNALACLR